jgi:prepilin-type N-terminal cleavage/methylation domain-containing protein
MTIAHQIRKHCKAGFTLTEIMVVTAILGLAMAGATALFLTSLKYYYHNRDKLQADRDLRSVTDHLAKAGTGASFFRVYTSFTDRTLVPNLNTGDFIVFAYTDPTTNPAGDLVNRIVCFYQENAASGRSPVRMYDSDTDGSSTLASSPTAYSTAILPDPSTISSNKQLAENFQDITTPLFYNANDRTVMVNARVFYQGTLRPNVSNTYNFAITPRG